MRQSTTSHVRQYIPPDSMRTFRRRRYRTPPCLMKVLPARPARPSRRSALLIETRSALAHVHQARPHYIGTNEEGAQYTEQHKEGGHDVCRECKTGQCDHGVLERICIARVMGSPNLCKSQCKGRNYAGVSDKLVETGMVPIHTANAYEEDKWNNHYRESAPPYYIGSPNDNGVT